MSAVRYLNTVPLVWGLIKGPQSSVFDLTFSVPSECADQVASGIADIGIVPCAELPRLRLATVPEIGIACTGPVRSILLVSRVPVSQIRTLAADVSSRTSVLLTRVVLAGRYGVRPEITSMPPSLPEMLAQCDAALIIGDPALHLDPQTLPYNVLDLGSEWTEWTDLPMVFALWAGRPEAITPEVCRTFQESAEYGLARISEIAACQAAERGISESMAYEYLTRHISFRIGRREEAGLQRYLELAAEFQPAVTLKRPEERVTA